jgi:hypothetical protein
LIKSTWFVRTWNGKFEFALVGNVSDF